MVCWHHVAVLLIILSARESSGLRTKKASAHASAVAGLRTKKASAHAPAVAGPMLEQMPEDKYRIEFVDDNLEVQATRRIWMLTNLATCAVWACLVILVSRFYQGPEGANAHSNEEKFFAEFASSSGSKAPSPSLFATSVSPTPKGSAGEWSFKVWKYEMHHCLDDPGVCMWSCFCPGIRWADSLNRADLMGFQTALFLFVTLSACNWLALGWGTGIMIPRLFSSEDGLLVWALAFAGSTWGSFALLGTYYRQRLRSKFEMEEQGGGSIIKDCLAYCCCVGMAIAQEARHVQAARRAGHAAMAAAPPLVRSE